jgi:hypothetical protein
MSVGFPWFDWAATVRPDDRRPCVCHGSSRFGDPSIRPCLGEGGVISVTFSKEPFRATLGGVLRHRWCRRLAAVS